MWRTAFLIFIALTTSISGMLLWQWKAYSKQNIPNDGNLEKVIQEIVIKTDETKLHITQKIIGLNPDKEYETNISDNLSNWSCVKIDGEPCESNDENPNTFLPNDKEIQFQYNVQIPKENQSFLINQWSTLLPEVQIEKTTIEIVDSAKREGAWIAGAPLKGFMEMDLIDFYLFSTFGSTPSLYWQPTPLEYVQTGEGFDYYVAANETISSFDYQKLNNLSGFPYTAVILSNEYHGENGKGLVFSSPNVTNSDLEKELINYYFTQRYGFDEKWLLDIFTAYITNEPLETARGKAVVEQLEKKLSEDELARFYQLVLNKNEPLMLKDLDRYLKDVKNANTRFFALNKDESQPFTPLYFYDNRKVVIAQNEYKDIEVMVENGKMLFPFIDTMTALGFELKILPDQETILLMKNNNSYRFYLNSNIFIYNEEDYGLLESPLTNINGKIFMKKDWIQTIFKVTFNEDEEEIKLSL